MRKHKIHLGDDVRDIDHKIGAFVYLRTRDEPARGQVTGYTVRPGDLLHLVTWSSTGAETGHYGFELSDSAFVMETEDNESPEESEDTCPTDRCES